MLTILQKLGFWAVIALLTVALAAPAAMAQTEEPSADPGVTEGTTPGDTGETGDTGDTGETGETDDEAPAFANPAQAAKAEALAEAAAEASAEANAEAVAEAEQAVSDAQAAVDAANDALAAAQEAEDAEAEARAQADLDRAMADLEAAQGRADQAVSDAASISVDAIASMRADGMGWGEIAHELGVHPSTVGLGHRHQVRAKVSSRGARMEMAAVAAHPGKATSRNTKAGVSKTPGVSGGKGAKSVGLSRASEKAKSGAKGSKSANDNSSSGRGNSGNSNAGGNGKSQGKGNSNAGGNGKGGGKSK